MLLTVTVFAFFLGGCLFFDAGGALDFKTRASCSLFVGESPLVVGTCSVEVGGRVVDLAGVIDDGAMEVTMARLVLVMGDVAMAVEELCTVAVVDDVEIGGTVAVGVEVVVEIVAIVEVVAIALVDFSPFL